MKKLLAVVLTGSLVALGCGPTPSTSKATMPPQSSKMQTIPTRTGDKGEKPPTGDKPKDDADKGKDKGGDKDKGADKDKGKDKDK
jgi:hypothetical protein